MKIFKFLLFIILGFSSERVLNAYTMIEFNLNINQSISSGDVNRFINMVGDCKEGKPKFLGELGRIRGSLIERDERRIKAFKDALSSSQNATYKQGIVDLFWRLVKCGIAKEDWAQQFPGDFLRNYPRPQEPVRRVEPAPAPVPAPAAVAGSDDVQESVRRIEPNQESVRRIEPNQAPDSRIVEQTLENIQNVRDFVKAIGFTLKKVDTDVTQPVIQEILAGTDLTQKQNQIYEFINVDDTKPGKAGGFFRIGDYEPKQQQGESLSTELTNYILRTGNWYQSGGVYTSLLKSSGPIIRKAIKSLDQLKKDSQISIEQAFDYKRKLDFLCLKDFLFLEFWSIFARTKPEGIDLEQKLQIFIGALGVTKNGNLDWSQDLQNRWKEDFKKVCLAYIVAPVKDDSYDPTQPGRSIFATDANKKLVDANKKLVEDIFFD